MTTGAFTLINAILIDPVGETLTQGSVTIESGKISNLNGKSKGKEINCNGKFLAPGIIDLGVKICEPGERHKESFRSAGDSAASGGVTTMVTRPDTEPVIDTPEMLEFFQRRAEAATKIKIFPMAAIKKKLFTRETTEMSFLIDKGAIAFSNGMESIAGNKDLYLALQYAKDLNALIIGHPQDYSLTQGASASAGLFASKLGIPSVPVIAERLGLERDLTLVEATDARYHADQITTGMGLDTIIAAKKRGLQVTAGTSIHHLTLNEFDIGNYRTFFKLSPPLRSENDRMATLQGVIDGHLDTISSFHSPHDEESKRLPFEIAAAGAVGLETLLPASLQLVHNGYLTLPKLFKLISFNPAKILQIPGGVLEVGANADLVVFDKDIPFVLDRFTLLSKSKNTPYDERKLQGKVNLTFVNGELVFQSEDFKVK